MRRKDEKILPENFSAEEPRFGTYNGVAALFLRGMFAKINYRTGNDIDGWRYELEYKNGQKRYPPTFLVEAKTEAEYNEQPVMEYEPDNWKKD